MDQELTHISPTPSTKATPSKASRILIVRLSAHGDTMHTLPLLTALRQANPDAWIGWLSEASAAPLLENHPHLNALHVVPRKQWLQNAKNPRHWPHILQEAKALLNELKSQHYEVSLDVQGLLKSALWPYWAKIPKRYGFQASREQASRLYTHTLPAMNLQDASVSAVERYLDFARALGYAAGQPSFTVPPISPQAQAKVSDWIHRLPPARPLIVLAPFTRWASKHWISEYWPLLMQKLLTIPANLLIIGAPTDQNTVTQWQSSLPPEASSSILNLAGQTDLTDLYALFEQAHLVIGLDSAPIHMANAVNQAQLLALFGPTAPGRTGPIGEKHQTLSTALACQPCFKRDCPLKTHDCMRQLTPEIVAAMASQQLAPFLPSILKGQNR